jgi:hypothetical protein
MRFVEWAAAVGAEVRQGRLVDLVDLLRAGRWAVGLGAVVFARLPAGLLGLVLRLALGERGGLALAGAGRLVELAAEALVLGLQVAEASLKGLAAGTRDGLHTSIIGKAKAQLRGLQLLSRDRLELDALNKYKDCISGYTISGCYRAPLPFRTRSRPLGRLTVYLQANLPGGLADFGWTNTGGPVGTPNYFKNKGGKPAKMLISVGGAAN